MAKREIAVLLLMPGAALAADDAARPALLLQLAKPVEITCATKSVVVKTNAANATTGEVKLVLLLKDETAKPATGAWRIASVGDQHTGSFGRREAKACAEACPLTVAVDGNIELWAPARKGISQLAEGELLFLAVLKSKSLNLRATTFSGKEIEALEEGTCRTGS